MWNEAEQSSLNKSEVSFLLPLGGHITFAVDTVQLVMLSVPIFYMLNCMRCYLLFFISGHSVHNSYVMSECFRLFLFNDTVSTVKGKLYATKEYERMEVNFHAFLTSELKWR